MIGILLILQAAFMNWRLAIVGYIALPAALVGGVLAAFLGDGVISLGSIVGFLTVLGIVARNGIMLMCHYQHLERRRGRALRSRARDPRRARAHLADPHDRLSHRDGARAAARRGHDSRSRDRAPMAVVILGGLITSTLLNLFVVPSLYLKFGATKKPAPVVAQ
jgi:multidrug efflux pump subunit AcrB